VAAGASAEGASGAVMFHADHSGAAVAAHILIAVLLIGAGAVNASSKVRSRQHGEHFAGLGVPFPWLALMVFTVAAMLACHHFWRIAEPVRRNTARLFFLNNCDVPGGLALIAEPALTGAIP